MKGTKSMWARFARILTPRSRGQIAKFAIAPQRSARLFRPLGYILWVVFMMGQDPFYAVALRLPA